MARGRASSWRPSPAAVDRSCRSHRSAMRRYGCGGNGGEVRGSVVISSSRTRDRRETRVVPPTLTRPRGDPGVARTDHPAPERHRACSRRRRICNPRSGGGGASAPDRLPNRAMAAQVRIHSDVDERCVVHRRRVSSAEVGGEADRRRVRRTFGVRTWLADSSSGVFVPASGRRAPAGERRVALRFAVPPGADGAVATTLAGTRRRSISSAGGAGGRCIRSFPCGPDGR